MNGTVLTRRFPAPPAPAYNPALVDAENNVVRRMCVYSMLFLVFLKFSSIHEFITALTGIPTRVMFIIIPVAILSLVLSGGLQRAMSNKLGVIWAAFIAWIIAGIPFSSWPGGSLQAFSDYLRMTAPFFFLVAGSVVTLRECRLFVYCAAVGATIPILFALMFGAAMAGDRLSFDFSGTIANPNDLAAHILALIPFIAFLVLRPATPMLFRVMAAGFILLGFYAAFRTGSRGAVVTIVAGVLMFLYRGSMQQRLAAAAVLPIALGGALILLPDSVTQRLKTFSTSSSEGTVEAMESAASRQYLLRRSIEFSLQHPVFGVGMGQFLYFEGNAARAEGQRGNWHETHNGYTQLSSEVGFPALLMFLAVIVITYRNFSRTITLAKAVGDSETALIATMATITLAAYSTSLFFLSRGYSFMIPVLSAFSVVLLRTFRQRIVAPPLRQPVAAQWQRRP